MAKSGINAAKLIAQVQRFTPAGRFLRWYAHQYRENSVVRIRAGVAKGMHWQRHHRYVNGYWVGVYELDIQAALQRELLPGQVFFDVGANAGFFTLVAAKLVGDAGKCFAFDPLPENCASIHEQIRHNGLTQRCFVLQEAVADFEGESTICYRSLGSPMAHLGELKKSERVRRVRVTSLDGTLGRCDHPALIKMDIEGGEAAALHGAKFLLRDVRPKWLIELHGPECERQVKMALREADYSLFNLAGNRIAGDGPLPHHFLACPN